MKKSVFCFGLILLTTIYKAESAIGSTAGIKKAGTTRNENNQSNDKVRARGPINRNLRSGDKKQTPKVDEKLKDTNTDDKHETESNSLLNKTKNAKSATNPSEGNQLKIQPQINDEPGEESAEIKLDSKPQIEISGSATVVTAQSNPNFRYYNGKGKTEAIKIDVKSDDKVAQDKKGTLIQFGNAEVTLNAKRKSESGWSQGFVASIKMLKSTFMPNNVYVIFEKDNRGTIAVGNFKGPEALTKCDGQALLGGSGGADGSGGDSNIVYATGVLEPIDPIGTSARATKIAYYTPKFSGFQIGFSLTPDTKSQGYSGRNRGNGDSSAGNSKAIFAKRKGDIGSPSGRNHVAVAITHQHETENGIGTKFAIGCLFERTQSLKTRCYTGNIEDKAKAQKMTTYKDENMQTIATEGYVKKEVNAIDTGEVKKIKLKNAFAHFLSAQLSYGKWAVGAGYMNNGKSRTPRASEYPKDGAFMIPGGFITARDGNAGHAWNVGASFKLNDKWTHSFVYHRTQRKVTTKQKTTGDIFTFATDYQICQGITMFLEVNLVDTKSCDYACAIFNAIRPKGERNAIRKQKTTLFVLGALCKF
ncbi:MAG: porin [Holosporales bacterium]|nr:porin [Holosporales bacterium]